MQLYRKTSGLLRSEVWFKEVEFQTGDKIKTSILGTPFLCVNILHVVETRHNTTKRASSSNVRKWAVTLKISFEGECNLKWKKKKEKEKKGKKKKKTEKSRRGYGSNHIPSDFGGVGFSVAPGTQSDVCLEFDIDCCSLTPLHFTPQYFFLPQYSTTIQQYAHTVIDRL